MNNNNNKLFVSVKGNDCIGLFALYFWAATTVPGIYSVLRVFCGVDEQKVQIFSALKTPQRM